MPRPKRASRATRTPASALDAVRDLFARWGAEGGKIGGKVGGPLRWQGIPPEERSRIARAAVQARWAKKRAKPK